MLQILSSQAFILDFVLSSVIWKVYTYAGKLSDVFWLWGLMLQKGLHQFRI